MALKDWIRELAAPRAAFGGRSEERGARLRTPRIPPIKREEAKPAQSAEGKRRMTNSIRSPASSRQDSISVM